MKKDKALIYSVLSAFAYIGLSIIGLSMAFDTGVLAPLLILLTLPVSFISFGIIYMEGTINYGTIVLIQTVMFMLTSFVFYKILRSSTFKR